MQSRLLTVCRCKYFRPERETADDLVRHRRDFTKTDELRWVQIATYLLPDFHGDVFLRLQRDGFTLGEWCHFGILLGDIYRRGSFLDCHDCGR